MEVQTLNNDNFFDVINNADKPVIVDFYADWCGPCKRIAPVVAGLAKEHADKVIFCKLNVDGSPEIAARYSVQSIPFFISFKNGALYKSMVGASSGDKILELAD